MFLKTEFEEAFDNTINHIAPGAVHSVAGVGTLKTALAGDTTSISVLAGSGSTFLANSELIIGGDKWTIAINSQFVTESAGVTVTQNEWTLGITAQGITESAGVTVTQGSSTGTLKTALSNEWTLTVLNTPTIAETAVTTLPR